LAILAVVWFLSSRWHAHWIRVRTRLVHRGRRVLSCGRVLLCRRILSSRRILVWWRVVRLRLLRGRLVLLIVVGRIGLRRRLVVELLLVVDRLLDRLQRGWHVLRHGIALPFLQWVLNVLS